MRLFFAIELPAEVQASLGRLRPREDNREYRWSEPSLLHVTLAFLGEQPAERLDVLQHVARVAAGASRPGTLRLGQAGSFGARRAPRVLWVGLDGDLQALASRQFDVVQFAWVSSYDPGTDAAYTLASSSVPTRANGFLGGNYGDYKNPRSDQLLRQLQSSIDPAFRRTALVEAQTIWQADLPVVPLLLRPITTATSPRLLNFRPTPAPVGETWNIEQWDLAGP